MSKHLVSILVFLSVLSMAKAGVSMQARLDKFASIPGIGIAVIDADGDTAGINYNREFMMASVVKFHQAVALTRLLSFQDIVRDSVWVTKEDLPGRTWSPLRAQCPDGNFFLTPAALLDYSLCMSDNNAADILFDRYASPFLVDSIIRATTSARHFSVEKTEAEMHADTLCARRNRSTPADAASLMYKFFTSDTTSAAFAIRAIMGRENAFGKNRLPAGIPEGKATIYHKTGTGETASDGHPTAVNDLGFVYYPRNDGSFGYYAIAVYLEDFPGTVNEAESIIAQVSEAVWAETMLGDTRRAVGHTPITAGKVLRPQPQELDTSEKLGLILLPLTEIILETVDRAIYKP